MAAGDLVTLANVKAWLNITSNNDDIVLLNLITAESAHIKNWLNRDILSQTYTDRRDGNGRTSMPFANEPVTAVSGLTVNGIVIPASPDNGVMQPGYGFDDTELWLSGYSFVRGRRNVVMSYTAGYSTAPSDIAQACVELVAIRYRERDRIGHSSKSLGGETVSFTITDLPKSVELILQQYKKVVPL